ncbi:hypothetical protein LEN26_012434 [Aphanomyces euteiches]|nr:hypothetical protein LEN26_012434 [Aphanomyces euteiches]
MRLLVTLVLATSAVMAFNEPRQDSHVLLDHQQVQMGATGDGLRVLRGACNCKKAKRILRDQEMATTSSGSSVARVPSRVLEEARVLAAEALVLTAQFLLKARAREARVLEARVLEAQDPEGQVLEVTDVLKVWGVLLAGDLSHETTDRWGVVLN